VKGLIAYTDSDYAADLVKWRSTTGYLLKLAHRIISWQSQLGNGTGMGTGTDNETRDPCVPMYLNVFN
jgi:hypothetical protein